MSDNIFQKACLIQLSTSCWQGVTTLQSNIMERIGNSEWLKGAKILVNPESLSPVRSQATRARTMLQKSALPFPVKGLTLVPKEALRKIDQTLEEIRQEFDAEVEIFISKYEDERLEARGILGDLFNDSDYPVDKVDPGIETPC